MHTHKYDKLGNYQIIRSLGSGGCAEVFLGEHVHLHTQAAIKVLHVQSQVDIEKFYKEAQIVSNLEHPNIIKILDFGVQDNTPFLVMDLAPGGTLRDHYPSGTILPYSDILKYVKQVSNALQYVHNNKLIHRDIKPANMLIGQGGVIRLSDFGIAVAAHSTASQIIEDAVGTWAYIAPEQIEGNPCFASDQYSLGIVVYEWLCGVRPFNGSPLELSMKHRSIEPPPLHDKVSIYPMIEDVVLKALAKNPKERFETVDNFSKALEEAFLAWETIIPSSATTQIEVRSPISSSQETKITSPTIGALLGKYQISTVWNCPLAWSPNSNFLAAGDQYGYVWVWDIFSKEVVCKYRGHNSVNALLWSLDGKYLFSAGAESTIQKWDVQTCKKILTYKNHTDSVNTLALAPSGKYMASGSSDETVIIWNIESGKQYFKYTGHADK